MELGPRRGTSDARHDDALDRFLAEVDGILASAERSPTSVPLVPHPARGRQPLFRRGVFGPPHDRHAA